MRKLVIGTAIAVAMAAGGASAALAASNPAGTGQPGTASPDGASCGAPNAMVQPNGFSSGGFANAQAVYANPGVTSGNQAHAISEYDIACYQLSQPH